MSRGGPTRREFLAATAAAAVYAAHTAFGFSSLADRQTARARTAYAPGDHRIRSLRLATATPLDEMERYYERVLEFSVLARTDRSLTLAGGATRITFEHVETDGPAPFYHVAFNIPENKWVPARRWLLERTDLDPNPSAPRDPKYDDVVYFAHWDAHALFFLDPAGNILELIARHTLDNAAAGGSFTRDDVQYASEIVFVFDEVPDHAETLKARLGLPQYSVDTENFHAIGDELGLLLVMRQGVSLRGKAGIFPTVAEVRDSRPSRLELPDVPYRIERAG